ncbi:hypothetical protein N7488_012329 [Penicillium malachiteum]|nr:hypothetical protein N7488_012329 [Penicillium malachiteum]
MYYQAHRAVIGRGSPQDLFDEQLDVRDLLRSQNETRWTIISTSMFTSFLFKPSFSVFAAEIILREDWEKNLADSPIFVTGDTISYEELAQLIERVTGKGMKRNVLALPKINAALPQDSWTQTTEYSNIRRYFPRVVVSRGICRRPEICREDCALSQLKSGLGIT